MIMTSQLILRLHLSKLKVGSMLCFDTFVFGSFFFLLFFFFCCSFSCLLFQWLCGLISYLCGVLVNVL